MTRILDRRMLAFAVGVLALVLATSSTAYALGRNSVGSQMIKNGAVRTVDLANGAVTTAKVKDGSIAGLDVADGSLAGQDLADGAVGGGKLADGAVGSGKLADGAVGSSQLADGSVGSAALANGSVAGAEIADGSIMSADIADRGVRSEDIADYAVGSLQLGAIQVFSNTTAAIPDADGSSNGGDFGQVWTQASCPPNSRAISGGAEWVEPSSGSVDTKNLYLHSSAMTNNGWKARGIVDMGAQGTVKLRVSVYCLVPGGVPD